MRISLLILCILFVICSYLPATDVSGNQSGIWTLANSPYNVIGNVTVPTGTNLTIEPGVEVLVMGNYQIIAQGNITANGTQTDSISFVNGTGTPSALWGGLRLENTTVQSSFSHCYIENGTYGINSINSPASINNCRFYGNQKGIQTYGIGSANPATVTISNSIFEASLENGIFIVQNSNTEVSFCDIFNNGIGSQYRGAIQLSNQSTGGACSPHIHHNHIHNNVWQGITAWDTVGANAICPEISDNLIENNYTGIYLLNSDGYVHHNTVINNFIPGNMNSGAGIMVGGATSDPYFENNTITGNYTGFYITNNCQPCLGNLLIYHAWAQGENIIRNNIDANGINHSVYCDAYAQSGNTLYAENNYWDANDAAGIAQGINDHNDNAALPTIDFTPWLNYTEPSFLDGTTVYNGQYEVMNTSLQLVSVTTGNVEQEYPVTLNQPFHLPVVAIDSVYVIIKVITDWQNLILYGAYGGNDEPQITDISGLDPVDVGSIVVTDEAPARYIRVGTPVLEEGNQVYPVKYGFFVYHYDYIDWLYQSGDFLCLKHHTRTLANGEQTWNFPANTTWLKVQNNSQDQTWIRTEIVDTLGTVKVFNVSNKGYLWLPEREDFGWLFYMSDDLDALVYQYFYSVYPHQIYRFDYDQDYLVSQIKTTPVLVVPQNTIFPLIEGNHWKVESETPQNLPKFIGLTEAIPPDWGLIFYWRALPVGQFNWTHYRIYRDNQLYGQVPYSQTWFFEPEYFIHGYVHTFYVTAYDGIMESVTSDTLYLDFSDNQDDIAPMNMVSAYPNPFNPAQGNPLSIDIGKASPAEVKIYNLRGQLVNSIKSDAAEDNILQWDGRDEQGENCPTGIYFLKISVDRSVAEIKKILLQN